MLGLKHKVFSFNLLYIHAAISRERWEGLEDNKSMTVFPDLSRVLISTPNEIVHYN